MSGIGDATPDHNLSQDCFGMCAVQVLNIIQVLNIMFIL